MRQQSAAEDDYEDDYGKFRPERVKTSYLLLYKVVDTTFFSEVSSGKG